MRPLLRILFCALLALGWSGLAAAGPHGQTQPLDSSAFRAMTQLHLDIAFERFVSRRGSARLYGLAGPSSMDCTNAAMNDGIETCVVTTRGPIASMPAALAQL